MPLPPIESKRAIPRWGISFVAVFAAMAVGVAASQGRLPGGRPALQPPSDSRSIDLGELEVDAEPRHTFTLTNTTDSALEIVGVHTSCGCEQAAVRVGERIGPGESLPISYSLSNRGAGLRRGTLTIDTSSEDPDLKQIVYSLSATIPRQIWTEPDTIEFRTADGSVPPQPISLVVYSADPALFSNVCRVSTSRQLASAEPIAAASAVESENEPRRLSFLVTLRDNPPPGMTMDYLTLEFEGRPEAMLHVPVIAAVDTSVSVLKASPVEATQSPAPAAELTAPEEME
jgi:hypothetical protein